jgi:hypothetical protein
MRTGIKVETLMSNRELLFGIICSQGHPEPQSQVTKIKFAIFYFPETTIKQLLIFKT